MGFLDPNFTTTLLLLLVFMVFSSFTVDHSSAQALLPQDEVDTLKTISTKLNADVYFNNVTQYSCINGTGMNTTVNDFFSNVTCDCNTTVCHIVTIKLKSLNLTGVFPEEFGNLTKLREIDLTYNYINGTLPTSLTKIPLVTLSVVGNRISGSIPSAFGDISTLEEFNIEDNLIEGTLPDSLGNLKNLRRILFSVNSITGTIPESYGNLKNLTDFRIDGNSLSGAIPEFIGNWTKVTVLNLQGTNMSGPIPSTISELVNLKELRISDLNGPSSNSFPNLTSSSFQLLALRNCSLTGTIPDSIGNSTPMKTLDLSFNKLTGEIPDSLQQLTGMNFMFLTNNSLTGSVPQWIRDTKEKFDLSYNNFTGSIDVGCPSSTLNLVAAFSSEESTNSNNGILWCMTRDLTCSGEANQHSLYINAGGPETEFEGNTYADNINSEGESAFFVASNSWAYSSTGTFMYNDRASFVASDKFNLSVSGIYESARTAPISLKYYGLCMMKGSYTVTLHFAEIMYSDDETFSSLGKRIFDISVQGRVIESNFNIAERAGGVGKPFPLVLPDIQVTGTTLEISMYWAGKGTTAIPARGVYGPLISAITVTPNFKVDTGGLSAGAIAGIVVACVVVTVVLILVALRLMGYLGGKDKENEELRGILQTSYFSLKQIKAATDDFSDINKIGEGGFGPVYKGVLSDGKVIAVKQLSAKSRQGNREFVNEIGMISALQHSNLVKLYGCCIEGNQLLLVYEYLENNSLANALFGRHDQRLNLDWTTRKKVCLGIAKGLAYLHEESRLKIVHRDIKATNVLLDKDLNAKISDFGLAKLDEGENTHISTRIAGTIGYMAPEYAMRGYLTDKADVYSFGIVALEIVSGKSNTNYSPKDEFVYLLDWAYVLQEQGNLLDLVDPVLGTHYSSEEAMRMLTIGLLCSNPSPTLRPSMSSVVQMLEGKTKVQAPIIMRHQHSEAEEMRFKAFEKLSQNSLTNVSSFSVESQELKAMSMADPLTDSSTRKLLDDWPIINENESPASTL